MCQGGASGKDKSPKITSAYSDAFSDPHNAIAQLQRREIERAERAHNRSVVNRNPLLGRASGTRFETDS